MDLELQGQSVIVTGGSGGIGRGLVLGFAAEGCHVVVATRDAIKGREVAEAAKGLPGDAICIPTDVTNAEQVQAMVDETKRRFGRIDVLVNNAGGVAYPRPFVEKPIDEMIWEQNLNIWGVVNCTRAVSADMLARAKGAIVNITSNSALVPSAGAQVENYAGTKGYVMAFSKALANQWGSLGVRINCVAPGWIVPWEQEHVGEGSFWKKYGYDFFGTPEQMAKQAEAGNMFNVEGQPIRRIGRPEDIADITLFLASERAKHLTGQLLSVSGGAYMP
jgi:NAD(P)-dependent dehydrogenase (short-subunit alcohol dehydrogenase family)